jgi:acyl-coenzyme A synthetase/AMP-(fatty) acid ligase
MGDLGYLDRGERLWFCGRVAERVPAGDMTFYTDPVEGVFNAHPDVRRCALIGLGESGPRTPALVVQPLASRFPHSTRERESFAEALRLIGRNGDQAARVRRFYFQHRLPVDVRHNIKINRLALARHYTRALR